MQKNYSNKMMTSDNKEVKSVEQEYFFPEHQITIKASTMKEAEEKLKTKLKKTKI